VVNGVHIAQRAANRLGVANIPDDQLDVRAEVRWAAPFGMNLRCEIVECADAITMCQ
jgi:hypothetical protein